MDCSTSLAGINVLYFAIITGSSVNYLYSGTSVYVTQSFSFESIEFSTANFIQKRVKDAKGTFFNKIVEVAVGDFMNDDIEAYEGQNLLLVIVDNNGNTWISGYEQPYTLEKYEGETGGDRNEIVFNAVQNSYLKVERLDTTSVTLL